MKPKKGYVYIIQCEEFFKIGYTSNKVNQRLSNIRTSNPFPIKLIFVFEWGVAGDALEVEGELHKLYKSKKQSGEWFKLKKSDIQNIANLYSENLKIINSFTISRKKREVVVLVEREIDAKEVSLLKEQNEFLYQKCTGLEKKLESKKAEISAFKAFSKRDLELFNLSQQQLKNAHSTIKKLKTTIENLSDSVSDNHSTYMKQNQIIDKLIGSQKVMNESMSINLQILNSTLIKKV